MHSIRHADHCPARTTDRSFTVTGSGASATISHKQRSQEEQNIFIPGTEKKMSFDVCLNGGRLPRYPQFAKKQSKLRHITGDGADTVVDDILVRAIITTTK